jgi:hypothetical protein
MKLAGQCGKLKCCLNYELDSYLDTLKDFPEISNVKLETDKGRAFHQKTDIFKRTMFFSYTDEPDNFIPLSVDRVKEIIEMNKTGLKPADLEIKTAMKIIEKKPDYENVVGQDSLTRFDKAKKSKHKNRNNKKPVAGPTANKPNVNPNQGKPNNSNRNRPNTNKPNNRPPRPNSGNKPPQAQ